MRSLQPSLAQDVEFLRERCRVLVRLGQVSPAPLLSLVEVVRAVSHVYTGRSPAPHWRSNGGAQP